MWNNKPSNQKRREWKKEREATCHFFSSFISQLVYITASIKKRFSLKNRPSYTNYTDFFYCLNNLTIRMFSLQVSIEKRCKHKTVIHSQHLPSKFNFPFITVCQEFFLVVKEFFVSFGNVLVIRCFNNSINYSYTLASFLSLSI